MATKKRAAKKRDVVSAKLPNGVVIECRAPGVEEWDRYIAKRRRREDAVGRREMVASCCVSHSGEEAMGALKRYPAAIKQIHAELDNLAGGSCFPEIGEDRATIYTLDDDEIEIRAPSLQEWEDIESREINPADWSSEMREFCKRLVVVGDQSLLERWPAMATGAVLDAAATLAGMGVEVEVKKA